MNRQTIDVILTKELSNACDFADVIRGLEILFKLTNIQTRFPERAFSAEIDKVLIETLKQQYGVVFVSTQVIGSNREPFITQEVLRQLVEEGAKLSQEFKKVTAGMRVLTHEDLKRVSR